MIRLFFYLTLLFASCAQVKPLTGGYEDTIPPNLIKSFPKNYSTNLSGSSFDFEFDEIIDASKLKEKLIVSPYYNGSFEVKSKKNTLSLVFDTLFDQNTTYILNFADGISDITEGNPAVKSRFVFSTGKNIDSSYVSGIIMDPLTNERVEGALVGLYSEKDSFDLFYKKPTYFSFSDEKGFFAIENIKSQDYKIYSFIDENKNFKAEYKKESFGYLEKQISVDSFINNLYVGLFNEDLTPLKIQAKRDKGDVYDVTYSKKVDSVEVISDKPINWSLNDNNLLRFYKPPLYEDSSLVVVVAFDGFEIKKTDSFYVSFLGNQTRKLQFNVGVSWSSQNIDDTVSFIMDFNLPLKKSAYKYDLLIDTISIPKKFIYFSNITLTNNNLKGKLFVLNDSVEFFIKNVSEKVYKDSLLFENDSIYRAVSGYYKRLNLKKITFSIPKGEFVSIRGDTLKNIVQDFRVRGKDYYGDFSGEIVGIKSNKKYLIELVSDNFSSVYKNRLSFPFFHFKKIIPGKFYLRVIEDSNDNFKWDYFGIKTKKKAESIFYYNQKVEIRSNWSVEDVVFNVDKTVDDLFSIQEDY
ncbi:MAG: hypothetical protein CMB64_05645 [Euryarchaeota archaeon]|nr:hypothetical protein [Euryarchaeota archaeon]|tara:strand:+ start:244 stop:1977 length:1734 start_codon:yes stop_codon:yes gene_type:complete